MLGIPTWYYGEAQCDWDDFFPELEQIDFEDKSTNRRRGVFRERNQISSQRFLSLKHFIAPSKLFLVKDFIEQFKRKDESEQMRIIEEVNYLIDNVIPLLIDENYSQYGGFYSIDEMFNFKFVT